MPKCETVKHQQRPHYDAKSSIPVCGSVVNGRVLTRILNSWNLVDVRKCSGILVASRIDLDSKHNRLAPGGRHTCPRRYQGIILRLMINEVDDSLCKLRRVLHRNNLSSIAQILRRKGLKIKPRYNSCKQSTYVSQISSRRRDKSVSTY